MLEDDGGWRTGSGSEGGGRCGGGCVWEGYAHALCTCDRGGGGGGGGKTAEKSAEKSPNLVFED